MMRNAHAVNAAVLTATIAAVAILFGQVIAWLVVTEEGITLAAAGRVLGGCVSLALIVGIGAGRIGGR
jgi:hypothetical protein